MHADRQLVFVCAQICRLFPCGSLYTQPSLPFSQPIAIPGGAFWLGGGWGASYILTSLLTSRMANLLLDCCSQNIQCDNHRSKSCYHLHVMLLQKALQSSSIQQLNSWQFGAISGQIFWYGWKRRFSNLAPLNLVPALQLYNNCQQLLEINPL